MSGTDRARAAPRRRRDPEPLAGPRSPARRRRGGAASSADGAAPEPARARSTARPARRPSVVASRRPRARPDRRTGRGRGARVGARRVLVHRSSSWPSPWPRPLGRCCGSAATSRRCRTRSRRSSSDVAALQRRAGAVGRPGLRRAAGAGAAEVRQAGRPVLHASSTRRPIPKPPTRRRGRRTAGRRAAPWYGQVWQSTRARRRPARAAPVPRRAEPPVAQADLDAVSRQRGRRAARRRGGRPPLPVR